MRTDTRQPTPRPRPLGPGLLAWAALSLAGCTATQPIAPPGDDLFFPAQPGCTADDSCLQPADRQALQNHAGGLGLAIWDTDLRRRELARLGSERTNQTSLFNAMLWPLGIGSAANQLRHPGSDLGPAALALSMATYGVLNSGIPERDQLYLEAARKLTCAIGLASADLYVKADLDATLADLENRLRATLTAYLNARDQLHDRLKGRAAKTATASSGDWFETHLKSGAGGGGGQPGLSLAQLQQAWLTQTQPLADRANQQLSELAAARQRVDDSGRLLRMRRLRVDAALRQALVNRQPSLSNPATQLAQIQKQLVDALAARNPEPPAKKDPQARQEGADTPPLALQDELARQVAEQVARLREQNFVPPYADARRDLEAATADAARWLAQVNQRRQTVATQWVGEDCTAASFAALGVLTPSLALPSPPAAQDPAPAKAP